MKNGVFLLTFYFLLTGCNQTLRSNIKPAAVNIVPSTFENPDLQTDQTQDVSQQPQTDEQKLQAPPDTKPEVTQQTATDIDPSRIIYFAQRILQTESRSLGTACNFYVHRVLQAAGFAYEVYLANDFDIYAKKYFKHYKAVNFSRNSEKNEVEMLRKFIWSYPERTPFIMQWSHTGIHGHIAFVERISEKLVIYQANLGTKYPHIEQTTPDILLNGYNRRLLTVYTEITPK